MSCDVEGIMEATGTDPTTANAAYLASGGSSSTVTVAAGGSYTATLAATSAGRYDYTVTASVGDGFARRFAGRLYSQA